MSTPGPESAATCPSCNAPIASSDLACPHCGANVGLMALLAETELLGRARGDAGPLKPVSLEQLAPRLGDYLVGKGYVSEAQLRAALDRQAATPAGQPRPLLGQTLVAMGALSHEMLDQAVAQQVLELQAALVEANHNLEQRVAARTAELEATLAKLQEFSQLKANFVANISHELRTPLSQIKGYAQLLANADLGPLTAGQTDALRVTLQALERLEQLINDLISYASAARGEFTLSFQPVSAAALIMDVVSRSQAKAEKKGVVLRPELPPDLPPVLADHEKLHWTVSHLVDNAIKFTPAGGRVVVSATPDGSRVEVGVRDTGIGIPAERLAEIFEPFQQLDGSSTRRYGGTGLGLALVRRIVEAHGSSVVVESQVGQGTTLRFLLPQAPG